MIKRLSIFSTAVLAAMLIAGLASASSDDMSSSSSSTSTSTTLVQGAATGSQTYDAGTAGQVTVNQSGASLSVASVAAGTDWTPQVEKANGQEVEVKFVNGIERIGFQAELEDGVVKTRVRAEMADDSKDDDSDYDSSGRSDDDFTDDDSDHDSSIQSDDDSDHDSDEMSSGSSDDDSGNHDANDDSSGHSGDDSQSDDSDDDS